MKKCFKCHLTFELSEFYKHPRMADGHLGKCKVCTRKDSEERRLLKSATDLQWVLAERERHMEKTRRARASGKTMIGNSRLAALRHAEKYPEKALARIMTSNAIRDGRLIRKPCEKCGAKAQAHHDDYSKPLDVRWLCVKHHSEHHVEMNTKAAIEKFKSRNQ